MQSSLEKLKKEKIRTREIQINMKHIDDQLDEIDKLIGKKIYNLRVDRDMSQSDLAKKAWVS